MIPSQLRSNTDPNAADPAETDDLDVELTDAQLEGLFAETIQKLQRSHRDADLFDFAVSLSKLGRVDP